MDPIDDHYQFLDLDMHAGDDQVESELERMSGQANALDATAPERARFIRARVQQVRTDLLTSAVRRDAYNTQLLQAQRDAARSRGIRLDQPTSPLMHSEVEEPRRTAETTYNLLPNPAWKRAEQQDSPWQPTAPLPSIPPPTSPRWAADASRERGRGRFWVALLLVILALSAGGGVALFQKLHATSSAAAKLTSTPTLTPTPGPTARPTPNLTTIARTTEQALQQTLTLRNALWTQSEECACDNNLASVETGAALVNDRQDIQNLQANGRHWDITHVTYHINSIARHASGATGLVYIDETRRLFQSYDPISRCDGGFQRQYHLTGQQGVWKIDSRQGIGPDQYCQAIVSTPTVAPTIGPTAIPQPTSTPQATPGPGPQADVAGSVTRYSNALALAAKTGDCRLMPLVATNPELSEEQKVCASDNRTNVHKDINELDPPFFQNISISGDETRAVATVLKHEDILFVYNSCGVPDDQDQCGHTGPVFTRRDLRYTATYYLTKDVTGVWLVYQVTTER